MIMTQRTNSDNTFLSGFCSYLMEIAHISGMPEFGMEDTGFILNSLDEMSTISFAASLGESSNHPISHPMFDLKPSTEASHTGIDSPMRMVKTYGWDFSKIDHLSNGQTNSYTSQPSFTNSSYGSQVGSVKPKEEALCTSPSDIMASQGAFGNQNYLFKACQGAKRARTDNGFSSNQDHIIAERKRREMLSQLFIALSAIVPGLKKMDKASVLGDAIKYLKQLQERVKTLEEQASKRLVESVVIVKKYELHADGDSSSSDENFSGGAYDEPLPEVEARIYNKNVLIRVHCEKKKGVLEKTVAEIEKLGLSIVNSSVLTFGSLALDITIIAEMNAEFTMTVKDLVKHLHASLKMFV
ncbi:transcription factor bHLH18-like isoform X2 [Diospyros lotus]|uniref:transcription factor bHLH18-like isoform X2 n=1 Tax=Diospyros lotus TaxID=55363 RepID=UPI0022570ADD|nr:transcription factor bHLH18-like isoform X2 [Diospyros lotus]XP_052194900.1 transcription factor bHLH18-like isoform X2 [Diospyros lotus]XP_052194901.1 transcription factor bHLH18-like isoform X2 [Diospyros lotus]